MAADDAVPVPDNLASTVTVTGNDSDPDGDALTVAAVGPAGHGTATVTAGVVGYTPANGYTGADTFTYTVADGRGGTATATVSVTVGGPAPVTPSPSPSVTASATPSPTPSATPSPTPSATPSATPSSTPSAAPSVTPPATQPATLIAAADQAATVAGAGVTLSPLGNDSGDGPLGLQSAGPAAHGAVRVAGNTVSYKPATDFWGTDTFSYTVTDAHAALATGTVTVTVTPGPAPADDSAVLDQGAPTRLDVLTNDPAGAVLAGIVTPPGHGVATVDGTRIVYAPAAGYSGADALTYRLVGTPSVATVRLTVATPAPAVADDVVTAVPGTAVRVDVLANDTGAGLTVRQVGGAAHGTAELRTDGVWYTPQAAYRGADSFGYVVEDRLGRRATGTVQATVPNAAPTIAGVLPRTVTAGEQLVVPFALADGNGDTLTLTAGTPTGAPDAATRIKLGVAGNRLTLGVDVRFSGDLTIPVIVSDGEATARTDLAVSVLPAPVPSATGRVIANPQARAELADPTYVGGRPVSRTLSTFVDSLIAWPVSPTTALLGYRVTLNGTRVCTVRPVAGATTQSCRVRAAIDTGDSVRVTAVGIGGTLSTSTGASITPASATNRLLAVVYFPTGEFALDATARRVLATVAAQARTYGFDTALMVGHTDADGTAASNAALSRRRADQVAAHFHRVYPALRADHSGRGETDPARPNVGDRNKAANRRVEIYVG
ncbi:hypothetical protein GCM10020358_70350 [Amorphoplanes nipponensis]|uniref:Ig-like domain-containing protein n=1 Tax=Actinoplanes nipponensis TaxID=135950 RepID=UPI0031E73E20